MSEKTDKEIQDLIVSTCEDYVGPMSDLYRAVGMLVVGRLFGWRVIRFAVTKPTWVTSCRIVGDLKGLMPERGRLAKKSVGMMMLDTVEDYWRVVRGQLKMTIAKRNELL